MRVLGAFGLLVTWVTLGEAWWIFTSNDRAVYPHAEVTDSCLQMARNGSCGFYSCLESRFPCSPHSFALEHGQRYCHRFEQHLADFTPNGREWVIAAKKCQTRFLLERYQHDVANCHTLNRVGWDRMSDCYLWEGFCRISWENKDALWQVFQARDLLHTTRIWRELLQLTRSCSGYNIHRFLEWVMNKINYLRG
ncbi:uncharacterized protein LOC135472830 [Liolophura sinensis]|uniref:uncharacterized protein LOC135472830 n=1 Tax=Liolophura sinensis TaxID=3198878 RepID=UPI003158A79E